MAKEKDATNTILSMKPKVFWLLAFFGLVGVMTAYAWFVTHLIDDVGKYGDMFGATTSFFSAMAFIV